MRWFDFINVTKQVFSPWPHVIYELTPCIGTLRWDGDKEIHSTRGHEFAAFARFHAYLRVEDCLSITAAVEQ